MGGYRLNLLLKFLKFHGQRQALQLKSQFKSKHKETTGETVTMNDENKPGQCRVLPLVSNIFVERKGSQFFILYYRRTMIPVPSVN